MADLPLTFGCVLYDRMVPLFAGTVKPEGIDLTFVPADTPREIFDAMLAGKLDASEMSSSDVLRRTSAGACPYVAIPVFPSRVFRHGMILVNRRAGIDRPKDLEGKRVGVPHFPQSAALWIRGLLASDYHVDLTKIAWLQHVPFRSVGDDAAMMRAITAKFSITTNETGKSLAHLLGEGEIDAYIGADAPDEMLQHPDVRRLFPNYKEVEQDFYRRTKIFPIMHTVVIRREVYEAHPFVAQSLFDALTQSKDIAVRNMRYKGTLRYMLPWMLAEIEELDALFAGDPFPYGIEPNRPTLEAAIGYLRDQSLLLGPLTVDEAFVKVT